MNAIDILKFFGEMGLRYRTDEIPKAISYIEKMVDDGRFIISMDGKELHTVMFFSISDDWKKYYVKDTWDYLPHDREGKTVYIEKAVSKHWSRRLRKSTETLFVETYPKLEEAIWHRSTDTNDIKIIAKRRIYAGHTDQDSFK